MHSKDSSSPSMYPGNGLLGKEEYTNILRTDGHWLSVNIDTKRPKISLCPPPVRIGADMNPVLSGLLAYVSFTVAPLGLQTHTAVIFLVFKYTM